jgi:hypothetical protein
LSLARSRIILRPWDLGAFLRGLGLSQIIGTVVCLLYAVVWIVAWFNPPTALTTMFYSDLHPGFHKYIPPVFAALLFAAAPVMRRDTVQSRIICSAGIVAMMLSGLWSVVQGSTRLDDAVVWLGVPLGIAAWVFFGPGPPEGATAPPYIRRPTNPEVSLVMGLGIATLVVGCLVPAGQIILDFGFGDIVVPRYVAVTFGLCCILGPLVARKLRSGRDGR